MVESIICDVFPLLLNILSIWYLFNLFHLFMIIK